MKRPCALACPMANCVDRPTGPECIAYLRACVPIRRYIAAKDDRVETVRRTFTEQGELQLGRAILFAEFQAERLFFELLRLRTLSP